MDEVIRGDGDENFSESLDFASRKSTEAKGRVLYAMKPDEWGSVRACCAGGPGRAKFLIPPETGDKPATRRIKGVLSEIFGSKCLCLNTSLAQMS